MNVLIIKCVIILTSVFSNIYAIHQFFPLKKGHVWEYSYNEYDDFYHMAYSFRGRTTLIIDSVNTSSDSIKYVFTKNDSLLYTETHLHAKNNDTSYIIIKDTAYNVIIKGDTLTYIDENLQPFYLDKIEFEKLSIVENDTFNILTFDTTLEGKPYQQIYKTYIQTIGMVGFLLDLQYDKESTGARRYELKSFNNQDLPPLKIISQNIVHKKDDNFLVYKPLKKLILRIPHNFLCFKLYNLYNHKVELYSIDGRKLASYSVQTKDDIHWNTTIAVRGVYLISIVADNTFRDIRKNMYCTFY